MHWIQSHVQDEGKRKSAGSKVMWHAGRHQGTWRNALKCIVSGNRHHWMHEENDEVDRLAEQSKEMDAIHGMTELLKGEETYVLGNGGGVAHGGYREWIIENLINKYMRESKSIGITRTKQAKVNAQLTLWASMMKGLDSAKGITWRLWSRMLTETLPTNHKLSRMAESNSDNIYKWMYREELGKEGGCQRKGRTEESETTDHAICGCRWAHEKWKHLDAQLDREWALKGWDWSRLSWIANKYEGWKRIWTAAGGVPRGIRAIIVSEFSPQMHSKIMEAAGRCACTVQEIWEERNEVNEEWLDSVPDLRERKTEAGRRQWRHAAQPKEKVHGKRTRVNQRKADREEHKKRVIEEVAEKMEQWEATVNAHREEKRMLRVGISV